MHGNSIYLKRFGMTEQPFSVTPDPRFFMQSRTHIEALAHLVYGIKERKGFITLVGPVGSGKTTVLRTLLENLDINVIFSHIINTDVNFHELLQMICSDFGLRTEGRTKVDLMADLFDFLVDARLKGKITLVVIDEAQNLKPEVMEALRMLSNFETPREKLVQILMSGQPQLRKTLRDPDMHQVAQRIVVNAEIHPLTIAEAERYIHHRLKVAGCAEVELFSEEATRQIAERSGGIPRIINILCDNSLMIAYSEGKSLITPEVIEQAVDDYFAFYNGDTDFVESIDEARDRSFELKQRKRRWSNRLFGRVGKAAALVAVYAIGCSCFYF